MVKFEHGHNTNGHRGIKWLTSVTVTDDLFAKDRQRMSGFGHVLLSQSLDGIIFDLGNFNAFGLEPDAQADRNGAYVVLSEFASSRFEVIKAQY
ncbi:hypothetical protein SDC9_157060 [bioreactor metagenome]|uniref:Uncharacterized protein n=1 Tax=bioreactor metagenome TaxID=1076179 RepID=A0A645F5Y2_9ZZZZ